MDMMCVSILQPETGNRIRSLIRKSGYSVRDIQELMGFENPQAVYKWMSGKSLPTPDNMLILSIALRVHMEDLLVTSMEPSPGLDDFSLCA